MTCQSVLHRVRLARAGGVSTRSSRTARTSACAALLLLSACYDGDFFDRLVNPDSTAAFRIKTLTLIDPHFYTGASVCEDSTLDFNEIWTGHLDDFDISPTLVLTPLDPPLETGTKMQILPAECVPGVPGEAVNCTDRDVAAEDIVETTFNNSSQGGTCGGPIMGSLNPKYMAEQYEPLNAAVSPCFASSLIPTLKLPLGPEFKLPLNNVLVSASYDLEADPQALVQGVIVGFLPTTVGGDPDGLGNLNGAKFRPWDVLAGADGCQLDPMVFVDDIDTVTESHDGVWMYFNFTAERVTWAPVDPMTELPAEPAG